MLLTPFETAVIMTASENTLVTTRQVYYRLNMYRVLGVKVGTAVRIPEKEIGVYYDDIGKRDIGARALLFAKYLNGKTGRKVFESDPDDNLPPDLRWAFKSVQEWRRIRLVDKQRKYHRLLLAKRNNLKRQLEFDFAA